jgi:hypothetical protein
MSKQTLGVLGLGISATTLVLGVLGYVVSIERRFAGLEDQQAVLRRVENLERMMFPVLVEFRLHQDELEEGPAEIPASPPPPAVPLPFHEGWEPLVEERREAVRDEVQNDIKRFAPEFKPE